MKARSTRFLIGCLGFAAIVTMLAPVPAAGAVVFQASSLPLQVRGEGLTETVGAVVLQATASGSIASGSSITIAYSSAIMNASSFPGSSTAGLTCSISGTTGLSNSCGSGVTDFATVAGASQLNVVFNSQISFNAGDYLEISQVRINVNALGSATTSVTAGLSGSGGMFFTTSQVAIASIVNPSIRGKVAFTATAMQTCGLVESSFGVQVSENYPAALTSLSDELAFSSLGTISNGTLINVTINNLPSGFGVQWTGQSPLTGSTINLVQTAPASQLTISTGSAITYTFSINGGTDSTSAIDGTTLTFNVGYKNGSGSALNGTVAPQLGTIAAVSAQVSLGPPSGIVSFATNNEGTGTVVTIGDCTTNLLFPFTTNQVGFDTNVQISNMSSDRLAFPSGGATAMSGSCTLTYYPTDLTTQTSNQNGNLGTPSQLTTPIIPAGGAYSFAQSTTPFQGQSGYLFAVCRFLDAHGFSFVTNGTPNTGTISQGLLALVIPQSSIATGRLANPSATCTATCTGGSCGVNAVASCTVNQGVTFPSGLYEGVAH
jgi:hypothetical protein